MEARVDEETKASRDEELYRQVDSVESELDLIKLSDDLQDHLLEAGLARYQ